MVNLSNGMGKDASSGSNIIFCLPNGTYYYKVSSGDNLYSANPSSGTIHVDAVAYPLYGKYIYPYENMNLSLNYADAKV